MTVPFVPRKQKAFLKCCFWPAAPFPLCEAILQKGTKLVIVTWRVKLGLLNQKGNYKNGKLNKLALLRFNFVPKVQLPFLSLLSIKSGRNIKSLMPFIKETWNVHCSFLPFLESLATCLFDGVREESVSSRRPHGNKGLLFKKETVPHAICKLSWGILNKRCEVLDSLVNTRPQAALLCSPLCFPKGELISTDQDNALFWGTSRVASVNIWFRL